MGFMEKIFPNWLPAITVNKISEAKMIVDGWDTYAREWKPDKFRVAADSSVQHLGDEWTAEDVSAGGTTTYGLSEDTIANFDAYLTENLLNPYLPSGEEGLEIGPGGGRLTRLLLPRTKVLHLVDSSPAMFAHLRKRFTDVPNLRYHHTDGVKLPQLQPESIDYIIAFDVFVHFEPRLVFGYLEQFTHVLKPGGTAIIHYSNVMTPLGWKQFKIDIKINPLSRTHFATLGVMCPQLMERFLQCLQMDVVSSDLGIIPRDAVAVFRKARQITP